MMIGYSLQGKEVPKLNKLYPKLFGDSKKDIEDFRKNFMDFAKQRHEILNRQDINNGSRQS